MDRPETIINVSSSLDGVIGSMYGALSLSTEDDWIRVHKLRNSVDAILIGVNTVINDNPLLTVRLTTPKLSHPYRIVLDTKCRIPLDSKILKEQEKYPTIVFTSEASLLEKRQQLLDLNVQVEVVNTISTEGSLDLSLILKILKGKYNTEKLLIEGGSTIITNFLKNNLVDRLLIFYRPVLTGSIGGKNLYNDNTVVDISDAMFLKIIRTEQVSNGLLVTLEPDNNK